MSTQSVTNARKSKDPLFSCQRSNVGTLSRTSVTKAPLVPDLVSARILKSCAEQLAKPQTDPVAMTETQCEPEQFQGRIIFMSMYNDIAWGDEKKTKNYVLRIR